MPLLRLILLLGIAILLLLFVLPNWAPSMQLVFLGIRSPAFPLSLWILGAIAAGIVTTLVISILFRLTGFTAQRKGRKKARSFDQSSARAYSYTQAPASEPTPQAANKSSDWEEDASDWFDDDSSWEDEPKDRKRTSASPSPDSETRSSYSYSYRDPKATRPAAPDSVVDADYRVIIPPNRNLDQNEDDEG
ncbi:hypothetical protein ACKFKG_19820 [Phormidesmis sp. 146-35]